MKSFITITVFLSSLIFAEEVPQFDGERAYGFLKAQCDFGPRVPGTSGHRKGLRHIVQTVTPLADTVIQQSFSHSDVYSGKLFKLTNVLARFRPTEKNRIWIAAHWDSRPWADQDKNPKNRSKPVLGANDGASGVAVLMELAHHLAKQSPSIGVDLVFLDGEDMGKAGDLEHFFNGSRYLAKNIPSPVPKYCILVDMIGDKDLQLPVEGKSAEQAPELVDQLWTEAEILGLQEFTRDIDYFVEDDHVVLYQEGGIPSVDIIDFRYGTGKVNYWHTVEDTPDKCSPGSLATVGTLLLHHIYEKK